MSAKREVHYPKIIKVVLSCHGNQDSKCYQILLLPQGTYVLNIRFVCYQQQTYEAISLLP